jgi:hypothetical protein
MPSYIDTYVALLRQKEAEQAAQLAAYEAEVKKQQEDYAKAMAAMTAPVAPAAATTVPTPQPAAEPPAPPKPGTLEYVDQHPRMKTFLTTQKEVPWVKDAKTFYELPTEVREKLVNTAVDTAAKEEAWTPTQVAFAKSDAHKNITYGDMPNNRKPVWNDGLDFFDRAHSVVVAGVDNARLAFAASPQEAERIRLEAIASQQAIAKNYSAYTINNDRMLLFKAREAKLQGKEGFINSAINQPLLVN